MYVVTNVIMVDESNLPEEQRTFCTLTDKEKAFSFESVCSLLMPAVTFYLTWAITYYLCMLTVGQLIFKFKKRGYPTLYDWFVMDEPWVTNLKGMSKWVKQIGFMLLFLLLYIVSLIASLITFFNGNARIALMCILTFYVSKNGEAYFTEIFIITKHHRIQHTL